MKENDKSKTPKIMEKVQKQLEKEETKNNKICKMYKKEREIQSKITITRTGNSHPKRREHKKKQTEGWYIRKIFAKRVNKEVKK